MKNVPREDLVQFNPAMVFFHSTSAITSITQRIAKSHKFAKPCKQNKKKIFSLFNLVKDLAVSLMNHFVVKITKTIWRVSTYRFSLKTILFHPPNPISTRNLINTTISVRMHILHNMQTCLNLHTLHVPIQLSTCLHYRYVLNIYINIITLMSI